MNKIDKKLLGIRPSGTAIGSIFKTDNSVAAKAAAQMRESGYESFAEAFSQGWSETDIACYFGVKVSTVVSFISRMTKSEQLALTNAKIVFLEERRDYLFAKLESQSVGYEALEDEALEIGDSDEPISNLGKLKVKELAAEVSNKRVKGLQAAYNAVLKQIERLDRKVESANGGGTTTIVNQIVMSNDYLDIISSQE